MFKRETQKRTIFALILTAVFVPSFIISQIGGPVGRTIGLITYILAGMLAFYEVLNSLGLNYKISYVGTLLIIPFVLFPFNDFKEILVYGKANTSFSDGLHNNNFLYYYAKAAIGSWEPWLITILASFLPLIFSRERGQEFAKKQIIITLTALLIGAFANLIWAMNVRGFIYILFFILIPVLTDTFGYFGGFFFGKKLFKGKKLAPSISPKKTWAGYFFGVLVATIFAIVAGYFMHIWDSYRTNEIVVSVVFGILLPQIAVIGDLLFSFLKRKIDIKDFSDFLPGHGGLLDRLDSISFVVVASGFLLLPAGLMI